MNTFPHNPTYIHGGQTIPPSKDASNSPDATVCAPGLLSSLRPSRLCGYLLPILIPVSSTACRILISAARLFSSLRPSRLCGFICRRLDDPNSLWNPIIGALTVALIGSMMYILWIASGSYN